MGNSFLRISCLICLGFGCLVHQNVLGVRRTFFYISAGLGAALVHFAVTYAMVDVASPQIIYGQMVGASGALYGILVAFAFMYPNAELMMIFLPIPIKQGILFNHVGDLFFGFSDASTGIAILLTLVVGRIFDDVNGKKNQFNQNRWDN